MTRMPIISKYAPDQQERLMQDIIELLAQNKVPSDLALMTLGNVATHILNNHLPEARRYQTARQFGQILLQSVDTTGVQQHVEQN